MNIDNIILSNHAKDRSKEIGIAPDRIRNLFIGAEYQKTNIWRDFYKLLVYGKKQAGVHYYYRKESKRYPPLLFTAIKQGDKYIIITVTKKKLKHI